MENWKNGMTALFEMKLDDLTAGKKKRREKHLWFRTD
jgi:hypothetical protein